MGVLFCSTPFLVSAILIIIPFVNFSSFRAIGEETISRAVFEEYVAWLQEKAKEKERRREEEKVIHIIMYSISE